ncbi:sensor histidine kinase [Thermomonospora umbrina]|nr:sensor histidine kinase [Thermomonospora umbrina]
MTQKARLVLAGAAMGAVITLAAAVLAADAATRRVHRQRAQSTFQDWEGLRKRLGDLGFLIARSRQELRDLVGRIRAGEVVAPLVEDLPAAAPDGDPFQHLALELRKAHGEAWNTVVGVASVEPAEEPARDPAQQVDVFVNLARRMQSLSHRAIQGLDELENQVEDPDLLKGLFKVDHLSTRMRRQAESLAVIGGASSRRQWTRPVTMYEVLRSAIAEVEHYNRVKVVPPVDGTLDGGAVADVIHLLAELIENATKFSPPQTQVLVRLERVTAGMVVEVEDRGLGIPRDNQRRLNELLTDPDRVDTGELLEDGRIGLLVVTALARRHNVRVQLQGNVYGGTQAVVVVPKELVGMEAEEPEARPRTKPAQPRSAPTAPSTPPASPAPSAPSVPSAPSASSVPSAPGAPASPSAPGHGVHVASDPTPYDRDALAVRPSTPRTGPPTDVPDPPAPPVLPGQEGPWERPPLPRRHAQTHLAPELMSAPVLPQDDEEIEHNPGLMAAFQRGLRSAQESDGAEDGPESVN